MEFKSDIGTIYINKSLFAKVITDAVAKTNGSIFISTRDMKIINMNNINLFMGSFLSNFDVLVSDNLISIDFYVISKFGKSLNKCSDIILNSIILDLKGLFNKYDIIVKMNVLGVKSKDIAKRNLIFEKKYEAR